MEELEKRQHHDSCALCALEDKHSQCKLHIGSVACLFSANNITETLLYNSAKLDIEVGPLKGSDQALESIVDPTLLQKWYSLSRGLSKQGLTLALLSTPSPASPASHNKSEDGSRVQESSIHWPSTSIYAVLAQQLARNIPSISPSQVQDVILKELSRNETQNRSIGADIHPSLPLLGNESHKAWHRHLSTEAKQSPWGSNSMIRAAAEAYQVEIRLWSSAFGPISVFSPSSSVGTVPDSPQEETPASTPSSDVSDTNTILYIAQLDDYEFVGLAYDASTLAEENKQMPLQPPFTHLASALAKYLDLVSSNSASGQPPLLSQLLDASSLSSPASIAHLQPSSSPATYASASSKSVELDIMIDQIKREGAILSLQATLLEKLVDSQKKIFSLSAAHSSGSTPAKSALLLLCFASACDHVGVLSYSSAQNRNFKPSLAYFAQSVTIRQTVLDHLMTLNDSSLVSSMHEEYQHMLEHINKVDDEVELEELEFVSDQLCLLLETISIILPKMKESEDAFFSPQIEHGSKLGHSGLSSGSSAAASPPSPPTPTPSLPSIPPVVLPSLSLCGIWQSWTRLVLSTQAMIILSKSTPSSSASEEDDEHNNKNLPQMDAADSTLLSIISADFASLKKLTLGIERMDKHEHMECIDLLQSILRSAEQILGSQSVLQTLHSSSSLEAAPSASVLPIMIRDPLLLQSCLSNLWQSYSLLILNQFNTTKRKIEEIDDKDDSALELNKAARLLFPSISEALQLMVLFFKYEFTPKSVASGQLRPIQKQLLKSVYFLLSLSKSDFKHITSLADAPSFSSCFSSASSSSKGLNASNRFTEKQLEAKSPQEDQITRLWTFVYHLHQKANTRSLAIKNTFPASLSPAFDHSTQPLYKYLNQIVKKKTELDMQSARTHMSIYSAFALVSMSSSSSANEGDASQPPASAASATSAPMHYFSTLLSPFVLQTVIKCKERYHHAQALLAGSPTLVHHWEQCILFSERVQRTLLNRMNGQMSAEGAAGTPPSAGRIRQAKEARRELILALKDIRRCLEYSASLSLSSNGSKKEENSKKQQQKRIDLEQIISSIHQQTWSLLVKATHTLLEIDSSQSTQLCISQVEETAFYMPNSSPIAAAAIPQSVMTRYHKMHELLSEILSSSVSSRTRAQQQQQQHQPAAAMIPIIVEQSDATAHSSLLATPLYTPPPPPSPVAAAQRASSSSSALVPGAPLPPAPRSPSFSYQPIDIRASSISFAYPSSPPPFQHSPIISSIVLDIRRSSINMNNIAASGRPSLLHAGTRHSFIMEAPPAFQMLNDVLQHPLSPMLMPSTPLYTPPPLPPLLATAASMQPHSSAISVLETVLAQNTQLYKHLLYFIRYNLWNSLMSCPSLAKLVQNDNSKNHVNDSKMSAFALRQIIDNWMSKSFHDDMEMMNHDFQNNDESGEIEIESGEIRIENEHSSPVASASSPSSETVAAAAERRIILEKFSFIHGLQSFCSKNDQSLDLECVPEVADMLCTLPVVVIRAIISTLMQSITFFQSDSSASSATFAFSCELQFVLDNINSDKQQFQNVITCSYQQLEMVTNIFRRLNIFYAVIQPQSTSLTAMAAEKQNNSMHRLVCLIPHSAQFKIESLFNFIKSTVQELKAEQEGAKEEELSLLPTLEKIVEIIEFCGFSFSSSSAPSSAPSKSEESPIPAAILEKRIFGPNHTTSSSTLLRTVFPLLPEVCHELASSIASVNPQLAAAYWMQGLESLCDILETSKHSKNQNSDISATMTLASSMLRSISSLCHASVSPTTNAVTPSQTFAMLQSFQTRLMRRNSFEQQLILRSETSQFLCQHVLQTIRSMQESAFSPLTHWIQLQLNEKLAQDAYSRTRSIMESSKRPKDTKLRSAIRLLSTALDLFATTLSNTQRTGSMHSALPMYIRAWHILSKLAAKLVSVTQLALAMDKKKGNNNIKGDDADHHVWPLQLLLHTEIRPSINPMVTGGDSLAPAIGVRLDWIVETICSLLKERSDGKVDHLPEEDSGASAKGKKKNSKNSNSRSSPHSSTLSPHLGASSPASTSSASASSSSSTPSSASSSASGSPAKPIEQSLPNAYDTNLFAILQADLCMYYSKVASSFHLPEAINHLHSLTQNVSSSSSASSSHSMAIFGGNKLKHLVEGVPPSASLLLKMMRDNEMRMLEVDSHLHSPWVRVLYRYPHMGAIARQLAALHDAADQPSKASMLSAHSVEIMQQLYGDKYPSAMMEWTGATVRTFLKQGAEHKSVRLAKNRNDEFTDFVADSLKRMYPNSTATASLVKNSKQKPLMDRIYLRAKRIKRHASWPVALLFFPFFFAIWTLWMSSRIVDHVLSIALVPLLPIQLMISKLRAPSTPGKTRLQTRMKYDLTISRIQNRIAAAMRTAFYSFPALLYVGFVLSIVYLSLFDTESEVYQVLSGKRFTGWYWFIPSVLDIFLLAAALCLVSWPAAPPRDHRFYTRRQRALAKACVIIVCHRSEDVIGDSLRHALGLVWGVPFFNPEQIIVAHNGNFRKPIDNTANVCRKVSAEFNKIYGRRNTADAQIKYVWIPIGNKSHALWFAAKHVVDTQKYTHALILDDDVQLPQDFYAPTSDFASDPDVKCISFLIRAANVRNEQGHINPAVALQDFEYLKAGLFKMLQSNLGSTSFAHGAISMWSIPEMVKVLDSHTAEFNGEDMQMGMLLLKLFKGKYRIKAVGVAPVSTVAPNHFICWDGIWCSHGIRSLFVQRVRSWDTALPRLIAPLSNLLLFNWNRNVMNLKPFILSDLWTIISDFIRVPVAVILIRETPESFVTMCIASYAITATLLLIFNYWTFRHRSELRSNILVPLLYPLYGYFVLLCRYMGILYSLFSYVPTVVRDQTKIKNWELYSDLPDSFGVVGATSGSDLLLKEESSAMPATVANIKHPFVSAAAASFDSPRPSSLNMVDNSTARRLTASAVAAVSSICAPPSPSAVSSSSSATSLSPASANSNNSINQSSPLLRRAFLRNSRANALAHPQNSAHSSADHLHTPDVSINIRGSIQSSPVASSSHVSKPAFITAANGAKIHVVYPVSASSKGLAANTPAFANPSAEYYGLNREVYASPAAMKTANSPIWGRAGFTGSPGNSNVYGSPRKSPALKRFDQFIDAPESLLMNGLSLTDFSLIAPNPFNHIHR